MRNRDWEENSGKGKLRTILSFDQLLLFYTCENILGGLFVFHLVM